jgi:2-polyprenyl-6-methoxyphenol hydroxylase-like FAD-dependent oxidoreductase
MDSRLPVLIIGTGPSALLLAHSLLRFSIPFRLFEKDLSLNHRTQGYRFRVTGRGVTSCRDNLSPEHFALLRASCADQQTAGVKRIDALTGNLLPMGMSKPSSPLAKDEEPLVAERTTMRRVLYNGLSKYTTFGKQLVSYQEHRQSDGSESDSNRSVGSTTSSEAGGVTVRFADGDTVRGSILVGADGAFSKVRAQLLPDTKLLDSSMRMAFGRTHLTPELETAMGSDDYKKVTEGTCLFNSPSKMFFMCESMRFGQRENARSTDAEVAAAIPSDYVYWALALRSEQQEAQGIDWRGMSAKETTELTHKLTENWDPSMRQLILHQDPEHTMPLLSGVMPLPLTKWRSEANIDDSPLVTLIGDAAHAMPPTAGVGATSALTDAAILGELLDKHGLTTHALEEYEKQMFEYGAKAIEGGCKNGKMFMPGLRDMSEMEPMERTW